MQTPWHIFLQTKVFYKTGLCVPVLLPGSHRCCHLLSVKLKGIFIATFLIILLISRGRIDFKPYVSPFYLVCKAWNCPLGFCCLLCLKISRIFKKACCVCFVAQTAGFVLATTPVYFIKTVAETISPGQRTNCCMHESEEDMAARNNIAFLMQH